LYPIDFDAQYGDGTRSRGWAVLGALFFLKALVLLPHFIVLGVLGYAAQVIAWFGYWVILFTGELPDFFHMFPKRVLQWQARAVGWLVTFDDRYPPFGWDDPPYTVTFSVAEGPGPRSRGWAVAGILFLKSIALIPHFFVLFFVWIAAVISVWAGYVIVVFTGRLPEGIFNFTLGATRWGMRLSAWLYSLTDEYPPFSLSR
jgi:hypothetical protein